LPGRISRLKKMLRKLSTFLKTKYAPIAPNVARAGLGTLSNRVDNLKVMDSMLVLMKL
jgi:hypothetical protein